MQDRDFERDVERDTTSREELMETEAFIAALSRGEDPSRGNDPLAGVLLALRDDVERPAPAAPTVTSEPSEPTVPQEDRGAEVVSLDQARAKRYRTNPWVAGLVGAAAASVAIVGVGSMLYTPEPSGTTMVELASTLDDLEAANKSGDEEAARTLLDQAQLLIDEMNHSSGRISRRVGETLTVTKTATTTRVPTSAAPTPAPATASEPAASPAAPASSAPAAPAGPASSARPAQGSASQATQPQQQTQPSASGSQNAAPNAPSAPVAPSAPAAPAEQPGAEAQVPGAAQPPAGGQLMEQQLPAGSSES